MTISDLHNNEKWKVSITNETRPYINKLRTLNYSESLKKPAPSGDTGYYGYFNTNRISNNYEFGSLSGKNERIVITDISFMDYVNSLFNEKKTNNTIYIIKNTISNEIKELIYNIQSKNYLQSTNEFQSGGLNHKLFQSLELMHWFEIKKEDSYIHFAIGEFKLRVSPTTKKAFHDKTEITENVKSFFEKYNRFREEVTILGYSIDIEDISFNQIGCTETKTKASDWLPIYNLIK